MTSQVSIMPKMQTSPNAKSTSIPSHHPSSPIIAKHRPSATETHINITHTKDQIYKRITSSSLYTLGFQIHQIQAIPTIKNNTDNRQTGKMLIYLWNFFKCALLKITALLWNACKLVHGELQHKLNNAKGEQQQQVKSEVSMANEVWTDVFSFIQRVELARTVSLTNRHIHEICWPRLHGNKVMPHEVPEMIIATRDDGRSPTQTVILLSKRTRRVVKEVPFANCSPPDYITRFCEIRINSMDDQVLAFIKLIAPSLTEVSFFISNFVKMKSLDEQRRGFINQLIKFFREKQKLTTIFTNLDNIPFLLQDMDNKTRRIALRLNADTDIPLLMNWLATPRPDGQQRVIRLYFENDQLTMKMVDALKQNFRTCRQPLPQPFYIRCNFDDRRPDNLNIPNEEENAQTDETLTISPDGVLDIEIFRHPTGEHEKWAEDARERINYQDASGTFIPISHM